MKSPTTSVVIPSRNYAHYLGEAVHSVYAQDEPGIEIIVVDDGSTDNTAEVVAGLPGVQLIKQAHAGVGAARNTGVARASGAFIAFLDADDVWAPQKLRSQMNALRSEPDIDVAFAQIEEFISPELSAEERMSLVARPGRAAVLTPSTILMRRATLESLGTFRVDRESGEALDWALRVEEAGLRCTAPEGALVYRRVHATNSGRIFREAQRREYVAAIKRALDRRRQLSGKDE